MKLVLSFSFLRMLLFLVVSSLHINASATQKILVIGDSKTVGANSRDALGSGLSLASIRELPGMLFWSTLLGHKSPNGEHTLNPEMMKRFKGIEYHPHAAFFTGASWGIQNQVLNALPNRKLSFVNGSGLGRTYLQPEPTFEHLNQLLVNDQNTKIIVVDIGSNDFMVGADTVKFQHRAVAFYKRLARRFPHSYFFILPIPNIVDILARENTVAFKTLGRKITCQRVLQMANIASHLQLTPGSTAPLTRKVQSSRLSSFNKTLSYIPSILDNTNYFKGKAYFMHDIYPRVKGKNWNQYLAWDCIHPNKKANQVIARKLAPRIVDELLAR